MGLGCSAPRNIKINDANIAEKDNFKHDCNYYNKFKNTSMTKDFIFLEKYLKTFDSLNATNEEITDFLNKIPDESSEWKNHDALEHLIFLKICIRSSKSIYTIFDRELLKHSVNIFKIKAERITGRSKN